MKIKNLLLIILIVFFGCFLFSKVLAARSFSLSFPLPFENNCPIPGACPSNAATTESIAAYIVRIYQLAVGLAGILAVGMIVFGSIYVSVSGDSPDRREEGKSFIMSAIWGLLLLLGSYVILRTINPQLVSLHEPVVPQAPSNPYLSKIEGAATAVCPNPSSTACFFNPTKVDPSDPSKATCLLRDEDQNGNRIICTAIDTITDACKKRNCEAESAVVFSRIATHPIKSTACKGGIQDNNGLGQCFLEKDTLDAFDNFYNVLSSTNAFRNGANLGDSGWRVTEAFPPTTDHSSECHYDGTCFDFAIQIENVGPGPDFSDFCTQLSVAYRSARSGFRVVYIETPDLAHLPAPIQWCLSQPSSRNFITMGDLHAFEHTTGFHLHIQWPK